MCDLIKKSELISQVLLDIFPMMVYAIMRQILAPVVLSVIFKEL